MYTIHKAISKKMRNVCMKVRIPKAKNFNIQRTHWQLMHIYIMYTDISSDVYTI